MASGYCTIFNDGKFRIPTCISRIDDYKGNTIYTYDGTSSKVYDINAAREMVSVLRGVIEEGWGTGRGLALNNRMPCAGKTGTTDEAKDGWFCGFTHYYTTSVWVGCDTPESVRNLQGATWPGRIWKNYMNLIHEGLEPVDFKDYDHAKEDRALKDQESHDDDWYDDRPENAATKKTEIKKETTPAATTTKTSNPEPAPQNTNDNSGNTDGNSGSGSSTGGSGTSEGTDTTGDVTPTGGDNTGGSPTGGDNTGGDNTGGDNTGGDNTGGDNTGGDNTGGDNTGGGNEAGGNEGGSEGTGEPTAQNTPDAPEQPQG